MVSLTDVLIDALWILGLAGVFATFSYIDYYRHLRGWRWRDAWQRPCLLMPLSLSLTIFSLGLTLNDAFAHSPAPWWRTAIWLVLTLLFAWQTYSYSHAGRQIGWDAPIAANVDADTIDPATESPKEQIGVEQNG